MYGDRQRSNNFYKLIVNDILLTPITIIGIYYFNTLIEIQNETAPLYYYKFISSVFYLLLYSIFLLLLSFTTFAPSLTSSKRILLDVGVAIVLCIINCIEPVSSLFLLPTSIRILFINLLSYFVYIIALLFAIIAPLLIFEVRNAVRQISTDTVKTDAILLVLTIICFIKVVSIDVILFNIGNEISSNSFNIGVVIVNVYIFITVIIGLINRQKITIFDTLAMGAYIGWFYGQPYWLNPHTYTSYWASFVFILLTVITCAIFTNFTSLSYLSFIATLFIMLVVIYPGIENLWQGITHNVAQIDDEPKNAIILRMVWKIGFILATITAILCGDNTSSIQYFESSLLVLIQCVVAILTYWFIFLQEEEN